MKRTGDFILSILMASVIFMVGAWLGEPSTIFDYTTIVCVLYVSMGVDKLLDKEATK